MIEGDFEQLWWVIGFLVAHGHSFLARRLAAGVTGTVLKITSYARVNIGMQWM